MSQTSVSSVPPVDDRLGRLIDAVGQIAQQQRSLIETLRPQAATLISSPSTQPYSVAPPGPPTAVANELRSFVADLFRQHATTAQQSAARDAYAREHLADLPEAYRRLMPETGDVATLANAEQTIRQQFREDLRSLRKQAGEPTASVGADRPGGQPPGAAIDYDRLSPMQQIALGLNSAPATSAATFAPGVNRSSGQTSPQAGPAARATDDQYLDGEPLFVGSD